jgi:hypothetical protein
VMLGEERDSFVERVRKWVAIHIRLIGWKPG